MCPYDLLVASQAAVRAANVVATRFAALPQHRQEQVQDAALALALSAVNAVSLLPYRSQLHPLWLALVLVIAQGLPLALRRARPVGAGLIIGVARVAYDRFGFGFAPFPLGPAIAVYTVVDRRGRVWRWVVAALVVAGMTLSLSTPGHDEPYQAIFQGLIFIAAWVAGAISRAKRTSLEAATDRAERAEAEIDRQARRAAAAERTKIARELHDVVAHHVSLMAVQAEAATSLLPDRPQQAIRSVEIIGDTARNALTELRRLLGVLRGPAPALKTPMASLAEIDAVLDQVRDAGLPVDLQVTGTPYPLAVGVDLTAYRIVQEALTNTLRHTEAATAAVTLSYEPGFITVQVADPGPRRDVLPADAGGSRASSPRVDKASDGFGLAGIAERVASCGGHLAVGPSGVGFAITARLPAR
jgi:signal transduction histidine kinase